MKEVSKSAPAQAQTSSSSASTSAPSKTSDASQPPFPIPNIDFSEEFARELTLGMKSLMQEIVSEAGIDPSSLDKSLPRENGELGEDDDAEGELTEEEKEQQRKFKAAWEAMLVEGMGGDSSVEALAMGQVPGMSSAGAAGASASASRAAAGGGVEDFQASIKRAMEKLKESDANAQVSSGVLPNVPILDYRLHELIIAIAGCGGGHRLV